MRTAVVRIRLKLKKNGRLRTVADARCLVLNASIATSCQQFCDWLSGPSRVVHLERLWFELFVVLVLVGGGGVVVMAVVVLITSVPVHHGSQMSTRFFA